MSEHNDPSLLSQVVRDNREAGEFHMPSNLTITRTRFFWWIGSGAAAAIIACTLFWVKVDNLAKTAADKQSVKEIAEKQIELDRTAKALAASKLDAEAAASINARITANTAAVDGFKGRFASDDRLHDSQNARMDGFKSELDRREPYLKKVDVMDFMREYGISNKEDYYRRHGTAPSPVLEGSEATPTVKPAPRSH